MIDKHLKKEKMKIKTLRDVPCLMFNEFHRMGQYFISRGLYYELTNPYYEDGNLHFELHDKQGFIGSYIIFERNLDLIEIIK
jgi:hypothetical protein